MRERSKWAFWTLVMAGLALICVPSAVLLDAVGRYERFLVGFEPSPLQPVTMRGTPHRGGRGVDATQPQLDFIDFHVHMPKAKRVSLVGDFNAWRAGTLPLARMPGGDWELTLPLPRGRYRYRYLVDGEDRLDPAVKEVEEVSGRQASVRDVK